MQGGFTSLLDRFSGISQQIGNLQLSVDKHHRGPDVTRDDLLKWVHATSTHDDYHVALQARVEGTCSWILQRPEVQNWLTSDAVTSAAKVLWVHGKPGSGKTIIAASLVEHLMKIKLAPVCYFFCFYSHEEKRQCDQILRSWVSQLVRASEVALHVAEETFKEKESHVAAHMELWKIFQKAIIQLQESFFVVDGFDECDREDASVRNFSHMDTRELFLSRLDNAVSSTQSRVLVISRDDPCIREQIRKTSDSTNTSSNRTLWTKYEITRFDTTEDIDCFARIMLDQRVSSRAAAELKEELAMDAAQKSEGMFLWIKLLYGRLSRSNSPSRLRGIISSTPSGLDQAYERDLQNVLSLEQPDQEQALAILRWTLFARRSLKVRELCEALIVEQDLADTDQSSDSDGVDDIESYFNVEDLPEVWDDEYIEDRILRLCGSLVDLRGGELQRPLEDQTVHFVHFSVKEYLLKSEHFSDEKRVHTHIATSCLRYLCYDDFSQEHHSSLEEFDRKMEQYNFLSYAGVHWGFHAYHCRPFPPGLTQWCNRLLDPAASKWLSYSEVVGGNANGSYDNFISKFRNCYPSPLFYASLWGLFETMQWLIERGEDVNHAGGLYGCPLGAAAAHGHEDAVKLLLKSRADVNLLGGRFGNALQSAAAMGHEKVVDILLLGGANVNHDGGLWNRPIIAASRTLDPKISQAIVCRLIEAGADVKVAQRNGETALHGAASVGACRVIELLIAKGAEVNAVANDGSTALHLASYNGHQRAVEKLVIHGADVKAVEESGQSALHMVAEQGYDDMVELLLDHGADVHARTMTGWTPLHCAAHRGQLSVIISLLEHSADINAKGGSGMRALHLAASNGHEATLSHLLAHGADISCTSVRDRTALHIAASKGKEEVVASLISNGANINATSRNGSTALHEAISSQHFGTVEVLLQHHADMQTRNKAGKTPLEFARMNDSYENRRIISLLENWNYSDNEEPSILVHD